MKYVHPVLMSHVSVFKFCLLVGAGFLKPRSFGKKFHSSLSQFSQCGLGGRVVIHGDGEADPLVKRLIRKLFMASRGGCCVLRDLFYYVRDQIH